MYQPPVRSVRAVAHRAGRAAAMPVAVADVDRIGTRCHRDPHVRCPARRAPLRRAPRLRHRRAGRWGGRRRRRRTSRAVAPSVAASTPRRRRPRREPRQRVRPRLEPRPGHDERLAHRGPQRLPIQRIEGRRIEQHAGRAEGVRVAQDAADVVRLGERFGDDERSPGAAAAIAPRVERGRPLGDRQAAAVEVEAADGVDDVGRGEIEREIGPRRQVVGGRSSQRGEAGLLTRIERMRKWGRASSRSTTSRPSAMNRPRRRTSSGSRTAR